MVSIESVSGFHVPSKTSESETCINTGGWRLLGWVYQENDMFHQQTRMEAFLRCWSNILGRWKQPTYTCREGVQERQSILSSTNNNNKIQNMRSDEFQHFETLMTYVILCESICYEETSAIFVTVVLFVLKVVPSYYRLFITIKTSMLLTVVSVFVLGSTPINPGAYWDLQESGRSQWTHALCAPIFRTMRSKVNMSCS